MSSIMIVCLLGAVDEARILAVFPLHDVKSHYNVYKPLLKRLNAREVRLGYEIVTVTHFPQRICLVNFNVDLWFTLSNQINTLPLMS